MLDSLYHMAIKLLQNSIIGVKMLKYCHVYARLILPLLYNVTKYVKL